MNMRHCAPTPPDPNTFTNRASAACLSRNGCARPGRAWYGAGPHAIAAGPRLSRRPGTPHPDPDPGGDPPGPTASDYVPMQAGPTRPVISGSPTDRWSPRRSGASGRHAARLARKLPRHRRVRGRGEAAPIQRGRALDSTLPATFAFAWRRHHPSIHAPTAIARPYASCRPQLPRAALRPRREWRR
jgi:hypothetical protein